MPDDLPGTPLRLPDLPGSKKCPHCGRRYLVAKIKKGSHGIEYRCPHCNGKVGG
jgi:predicted Zn finger-like uncharacterized protein